MNKEKQENKRTNLEEKYYFFLNDYPDMAFTKCPKCENKTRQKKLPLVITFGKKDRVLSLNKTCRYCERCELLIAKEAELSYMAGRLLGREAKNPDYCVVGTMAKEVWKKWAKGGEGIRTQLEGISFFKGAWAFEVKPAGWYFKGVK